MIMILRKQLNTRLCSGQW